MPTLKECGNKMGPATLKIVPIPTRYLVEILAAIRAVTKVSTSIEPRFL
jgi:hypothetical protein